MAQKPANESFPSASTSILSGSALETIFQKNIDTSFVQFARDITIYLAPGKSLPAINAEHFNPFSGGQDKRLDNADTGNKGVDITPIYVVYKAHIKHGPQDVSKENPFALNVNEVATTTVYTSLEDINSSIEADIDGIRFIVSQGPRPIGFSTTKYLITTWKRKIDGR